MDPQMKRPVAEGPTAPILAIDRRDRELAAKQELRDQLESELKEVMHENERLEADRDACQHAYAIALHAIEVRGQALTRALSVYHEDEPDEDELVEDEPPPMQMSDPSNTSGFYRGITPFQDGAEG